MDKRIHRYAGVMNINFPFKYWYHWLATGFGSGLTPKMPGTAGTLAVLPVYLLLQPHWFWYSLVLLAMLLGGPWLCARAAHDFCGDARKDHQRIVWDEWAGMLITLYAVPFSWSTLLAGFVLFRFFDMLKPWPISWCDRHIKGGIGIMLDDVLAGLAAALLLHWLLPYL